MKTICYRLILAIVCSLILLACDKTYISGTYIAPDLSEGLFSQLGAGDVSRTLDFKRDRTLVKTFMGKQSFGTYTIKGKNVTASINYKQDDGGLITEIDIFKIDGTNLIDQRGAKYILKK